METTKHFQASQVKVSICQEASSVFYERILRDDRSQMQRRRQL